MQKTYIDREELMEELLNGIDPNEKDYTEEQIKYLKLGWNMAVDVVKTFSSVETAVSTHGGWDICFDENDNEMARCSVCGADFYNGDDAVKVTHFCNYCPNCGSRLDNW